MVVRVRQVDAYSAKTSSQGAGSASGAKSVSAAVKGLANGTVYHFRLVAKSDAGTTAGAEQTFQTAGVTLAPASRELIFGRTVVSPRDRADRALPARR